MKALSDKAIIYLVDLWINRPRHSKRVQKVEDAIRGFLEDLYYRVFPVFPGEKYYEDE